MLSLKEERKKGISVPASLESGVAQAQPDYCVCLLRRQEHRAKGRGFYSDSLNARDKIKQRENGY